MDAITLSCGDVKFFPSGNSFCKLFLTSPHNSSEHPRFNWRSSLFYMIFISVENPQPSLIMKCMLLIVYYSPCLLLYIVTSKIFIFRASNGRRRKGGALKIPTQHYIWFFYSYLSLILFSSILFYRRVGK